MVAMNVALAAINLWFIRKLLRERHDVVAYEVLEVDVTDAYLRHGPKVHSEDIHRFFPTFTPTGAAQGRWAFLLVQRAATRRSVWSYFATPVTASHRLSSTT
jgi:hypothetical protein